MPENFNRCVAEGGRVRTIKVGQNKYVHVCYKDGKSYSGEVKQKKVSTKEE
jgi:hypothetical protein